MKLITRHTLAAAPAVAATAVAVCFAAGATARLLINGKLASTDVKVINGKAYAPIGDIAKALNMVVTKNGSTIELSVAGGANQIEGSRQGKIGSDLFTGKWRFTVTGVETVEEYVERYSQEKRSVRPKGAGETLVIVNCRIKNGVQQTQAPILTERMCGNTALADARGRSHAPLDIDAAQESNKTQNYSASPLLPGAGMDFALVFSVPADVQPKALVMTLLTYPNDVGGKGTDVRVGLTE